MLETRNEEAVENYWFIITYNINISTYSYKYSYTTLNSYQNPSGTTSSHHGIPESSLKDQRTLCWKGKEEKWSVVSSVSFASNILSAILLLWKTK